jgi:hypothetical protein
MRSSIVTMLHRGLNCKAASLSAVREIAGAIRSIGVPVPSIAAVQQGQRSFNDKLTTQLFVEPVQVLLPARRSKHDAEVVMELVAIARPRDICEKLMGIDDRLVCGDLSAIEAKQFWDTCDAQLCWLFACLYHEPICLYTCMSISVSNLYVIY